MESAREKMESACLQEIIGTFGAADIDISLDQEFYNM